MVVVVVEAAAELAVVAPAVVELDEAPSVEEVVLWTLLAACCSPP